MKDNIKNLVEWIEFGQNFEQSDNKKLLKVMIEQ